MLPYNHQVNRFIIIFHTLEFFYGVIEVGHLIVSTKKGKWFEIITSSIDKGKLVSDFFPTKSIDPYKIGGIVPRSLFWCKFLPNVLVFFVDSFVKK